MRDIRRNSPGLNPLIILGRFKVIPYLNIKWVYITDDILMSFRPMEISVTLNCLPEIFLPIENCSYFAGIEVQTPAITATNSQEFDTTALIQRPIGMENLTV